MGGLPVLIFPLRTCVLERLQPVKSVEPGISQMDSELGMRTTVSSSLFKHVQPKVCVHVRL